MDDSDRDLIRQRRREEQRDAKRALKEERATEKAARKAEKQAPTAEAPPATVAATGRDGTRQDDRDRDLIRERRREEQRDAKRTLKEERTAEKAARKAEKQAAAEAAPAAGPGETRQEDSDRNLIRERRREEQRDAKRALKEDRTAEKAARKAEKQAAQAALAGPAVIPVTVLDEKMQDAADLPLLFVTHHKCASTLAGSYVRKFAQENGLTFFGHNKGNVAPSPRHNVSFLGNASYPFLGERVTTRAVHIIRNPLSIVASAYYSHLRTHPVDKLPILAAQRQVLEQCSLEEGLALTLAFCERNDFYPATPGPLCALRQWNFDDERFVTIRMEDFGERVDLALQSALGKKAERYTWPDPNDFTFQAMSGGRDPGEVDDHSPYRSGDPEAWRRELPKPIIDFIRTHHRPVLERFYPESLFD